MIESTAPFKKLFGSFIEKMEIDDPTLFNAARPDQTSLAKNGYELYGDPAEFHGYEKYFISNYHDKPAGVVLKRYFMADDEVKSGIRIVSGVRLIAALKLYKELRNLKSLADADVKFYFFYNKLDGAVIFDDAIVMRFSAKKGGSYLIKTLESDLSRIGQFQKVATHFAKTEFKWLDLRRVELKRKDPFAFHRLLRYYRQS